MNRNYSTETTADGGTLAEDAKALLTATAEVAEDKVVAARHRLSAALERGREAWGSIQERAAHSARVADKTIHEHPYQAIGVAFGVGMIFGFLLTRRHH